MSNPPTPSRFLTAWLCTVVGIGCPAAQVKPPEPADCPKEATEAMFRELKLRTDTRLRALVDINQPLPPDEMLNGTNNYGVYQDGPVIGRILWTENSNLPEGTLLHGYLWTGPGIYDVTGVAPEPAVMGRYTQAVLPDGRKYPVCIVLGGSDGRVPKEARSKPGAAVIGRDLPVSVVERWP